MMMRAIFFVCALCAALPALQAAVADLSEKTAARIVSHGTLSHNLTNFGIWSPDSQWIVCDERDSHDAFTGTRLLRINAHTGASERIYEALNGGTCGVVTHSPTDSVAVFIAGPEAPSPDWDYGFSRRRGLLVGTQAPHGVRALDAQNYLPPFAVGALRGGTHVHVFSGDGQWVSFTYDDEVLSALDNSANAPTHEPNQRNVGVSVPNRSVKVNRNHPRNHDGDYFSVLVTRTVAAPQAGADDIAKAFEEAWVGRDGYRRADGQWQKKALAFQGLVTGKNGEPHSEVFIVDLPEDLTVQGDLPLAGTLTTRPAPPKGVIQRRLTRTDDRLYPGLQGPRQWLRSSPDGEQIAFLMRDAQGIVQLWSVSPRGGEPRQISQHPWDIASAFSWSNDGRFIAHVMDNSVFLTEVATGQALRLTKPADQADALLAGACVFSPDDTMIAYGKWVDDPSSGKRQPQVALVDVAKVMGKRSTP